MIRIFLNLSWIIGIVYGTIPIFWIVVHPFAKFWKERAKSPLWLLTFIWLAMMFLAGWATYPWREHRLYDHPASWLVSLALFAAGLLTYRRIGRGFGRARLIGLAEVRPKEHEQRLVTTGMHARVRHPIYLAHFCMLTAWTVGSGTGAMFGLWVFAVVTGSLMIYWEDRELETRFGEEYREYRARVPAIIPWF